MMQMFTSFQDDESPIEVLSLVQLYVVLPSVFGVVKSIIDDISLLHNTISSTLSMSGEGLTVIVNVSALPSPIMIQMFMSFQKIQ